MIRSSLGTFTKNAVYLMGSSRKQMSSHTFGVASQPSSALCNFCSSSKHLELKYTVIDSSKVNYGLHSIDFQAPRGFCFLSNISKAKNSCHSLTFKSIFNPGRYHRTRIFNSGRYHRTCVNISIGDENMGLLVPTQRRIPRSKGNSGLASWQQRRASTGLLIGLLVCFSTSGAANAEAPDSNGKRVVDCDTSAAQYSHGKNVYTDYSVIRIPGDGRCLFRSVAHGACLRSGKSAPNESLQRELADELRAMVADEFVRRREETEWFIEGDFDTYVSQIRKPHVWGGEPELLMASHVLRMPITVYMYDKDCGGLISIAEYGQEYGKDDSIKVLYHGFGHYDALHIPGKGGSRSRL